MKKKGNEKIGKEREKSIAERFAEELVEEIKEDFKERQQARRPYELSWQLNMNFLAGNQYCSVAGDSLVEDEKTFEWQEKQVFNHIAPVYETRLAKLSRVRPKMTVRPFTDEDKDVNSAKLAKKILESCSEKLSVNGIIDKGTMWSEACGTVFYKIVWDKEKGVKIKSDDKVYTCGDVSVSVVPPFEIYPDSSVCADLDECKSIIHAKAYSSAEVKEIWGADVKGEELKVFSLDGGVSMGGRSYNKTAPGVTEQVKKDAVLVIERYTRPTKQNPDGELTVVAGDVLVYSGPLPYRNGTDGERDFPFVRQVSILWAGCFWGVSMIERLVPLQRAYNAVKCRKHEFLNRISMGVLAVEDGSTDGSGAILAEYARQGGVTVLHPEQGGSAARARNTGLARAVGRWVLFVDCDDCLLPDAVETLLTAQARTGADIVQGGWQYCDEADTRGAVQQYAEACYTGPRRLDVVELPGTPWGKLYRRTLFERVRFPSGYTCFEDAMIHFWVFPRAKCIASTKPVVYLWRKNTIGLTATSQNTAKALQAYWVAEEMLDGAVRLGLPQDALFACNLILQLANYCYVCVAGLPEADRQTAFACCCLLYRRWATKLPDPRTLPYAVRLAQRALEQADYGLWQLQGRLFQLIN